MTSHFAPLSTYAGSSNSVSLFVALLLSACSSSPNESLNTEGKLRRAFSNYLRVFENRELEHMSDVTSQRYLNFVTNQLTSMKRTLTSETMGSLIRNAPSLYAANIEEIIVNGPTAGVILAHENLSANGESQLGYWLVRFVEEDAAWKVDYPRQIYGSEVTYSVNGYEVLFQQADFTRSFLIDGKVPVAPELFPFPDFVAYMRINCSSCELQVTVNGILQEFSMPGMGLVLGGLNYGENMMNLKILEPGVASSDRQITVFHLPESENTLLSEPEETIFLFDFSDTSESEFDVRFDVEN